MIPYPYYFYGSEDSTDVDVLIHIPKSDMPIIQEDRKIFLKNLEIKYNFENWNSNLICIENGIVVDTVYPKTWIDSINNSLYNTYNLHQQKFDNPIITNVKRNKLLAIYKTVRTVLAMLSRTYYRTDVKPILKGIHDFNLKLDALLKIDFTTINSFNQDNTSDIDIWKIITFYVNQNISLIENDIEIYTKKDLVKYHPNYYNFIYRKDISNDRILLNNLIKNYVFYLKNNYTFISKNNILSCNDEMIDMKNEIYL